MNRSGYLIGPLLFVETVFCTIRELDGASSTRHTQGCFRRSDNAWYTQQDLGREVHHSGRFDGNSGEYAPDSKTPNLITLEGLTAIENGDSALVLAEGCVGPWGPGYISKAVFMYLYVFVTGPNKQNVLLVSYMPTEREIRHIFMVWGRSLQGEERVRLSGF